MSDPKIFDNRTLALMLDSLNDSLRSAQFFDAKSLAAAIGTLQGSQQESLARSFSLQGPPLPGVVDTSKATSNTGSSFVTGSTGSSTTGQSGSQSSTTTGTGTQTTGTTATTGSGTSGSDISTTSASNTATSGGTTERTTQTTTAPRTPVNPDLPALLAAPNFNPQFGTSASDLLSDQVNLTYQIFNLRMLLERALSDRLIGGSPRLQAVLGFNVTLDPNHDFRDSAAFVEVTVKMHSAAAAAPISVVALMPQEKTYNSVALSTKSTAFGGSAVSQLISFGFSERKQSQLFYLFRDNDTIALHRSLGAAAETTLGWSFRPVLGRRSVSPGIRQMFAVISLPAADGAIGQKVPIDVTVKTYWRRYDRDTLTTSDTGKTVTMSATMSGCVLVPSTNEFQDKLSPRIGDIEWRQTDDKTALVAVQGRNFFQGTTVRLGAAQYATPADGLTLKSDMAFDLAVPVSALLGDGSIVGRYGVAKAMVRPAIPVEGIAIQSVTWRPAVGKRIELEISLTSKSGTLNRATFPLPLVVSLNGSVIPPPYDLSADGKTLRAYVPTDQFTDFQGLLSVRFPFAGDRWQATWRIYDPSQAFTVTRYAASPGPDGKPGTTKLLIATNDVANGFMCRVLPAPTFPLWQVVLDKAYDVQRSPAVLSTAGAVAISGDLMEFLAPADMLDKHALLLRNCDGAAFKLAVPAATPKPDKTAVTSIAPATVKVNDARKVTISGKALDHVASVTANGVKLESHPGADGTTLDVFLIRKLTDHAATMTLICRDDKGEILGSIDIVIQ